VVVHLAVQQLDAEEDALLLGGRSDPPQALGADLEALLVRESSRSR